MQDTADTVHDPARVVRPHGPLERSQYLRACREPNPGTPSGEERRVTVATKERREYRVVWQRQPPRRFPECETSRKYAKYDSREAAERKALRLQYRLAEAYGADPNSFFCCDGHGCGCCGETWAEREARFREENEPLKFLRIDSRPVGKWETEEEIISAD